MKTVGIIAEYNPFHNGHLYQINHIRQKLNADFIIIAMSGDFVQRGTPALLPKHCRTQMALNAGADLVLEIPVAHSTASAEFFAQGGIATLNHTGVVDEVCFGCETQSSELMLKIAEILSTEPADYASCLQQFLKQGHPYPAARSLAMQEYVKKTTTNANQELEKITQLLSEPNNILGIEYCKALIKYKSGIKPSTLKREGASFHETRLNPNIYPSATAIRQAISTKELDCLDASMPQYSVDSINQAVLKNELLIESDLDLLLHYKLLQQDQETLLSYYDISESLTRRILNLRNQYTDFYSFTKLLKTKDITFSHIQRALLHLLLNLYEQPSTPAYLRVLGFRKQSSALLHEIKKRASAPLLTKLADAPDLLNENAIAQLEQTIFASNIYESILCQKSQKKFEHELQKRLVII